MWFPRLSDSAPEVSPSDDQKRHRPPRAVGVLLGALTGAMSCCGCFIMGSQKMGAAGGGDALDGIVVTLLLTMCVGGVGGAGVGWVAGWAGRPAERRR